MTFHAYKQSQKCGFDLKPFAAIEKRVLEAKTRKQQSIKSNLTIAIEGPVKSIARQLPLWPEGRRAIPNLFVRSALFNARNKRTPRKFLKEAPIFVIGEHGSITYTGEELRQEDATVWLQLIQLAKDSPLGSPIEFTPYAFCTALGWRITGGAYSRLREILTRLQATSLKAYSRQLERGVSLSMLPKFEWRDQASNTSLKKYRVTIAEELLDLFSNNRYTRVEWGQRLLLSTGVATWLHGYFASHKNNFALCLETIKHGCGIETSSTKHLKATIENALKQLCSVGFITAYVLEEGRVHVTRL
jgi:hypothetical protein